MDLQGSDFSYSRDPIFSGFRDPMIFFSDSRDLIFNSRDPNRVPKTPLKTVGHNFLRTVNLNDHIPAIDFMRTTVCWSTP